MKKRLIFAVIILLIFSISTVYISCKKETKSCYDEELYKLHKDDVCTEDCPGVIGCDGKTYCNECMANKQGIRVDQYNTNQ